MNTLKLYPYLYNGTWVFDNEQKKLKREAFVMGMSEIISDVVSRKKLCRPRKGFTLTFSAEPFNHDIELTWFKQGDVVWKWEDKEKGPQEYRLPGNWYHTGTFYKKGPKAGWLCPALLKFFETAPEKLYCKAEPLEEGVNPIWDVPEGFAFVKVA